MLRLAVPSGGALHEPSLAFLESCGLEVLRASLRSYAAEIPSLRGVTVHFQRASDIATAVENGTVEMGIVGEDQFLEKRREGGSSSIAVHGLGFGHSELVIGVPDFWVDVTTVSDLADLAMEFKGENGDLLRVATKYPRLVERFLLKNGVNYFSEVLASGTLEAAPLMGSADIVADISSTGATLRENRLKTIYGGTVMSSEACLIINRAHLDSVEDQTALADRLVEKVEERLRSLARE